MNQETNSRCLIPKRCADHCAVLCVDLCPLSMLSDLKTRSTWYARRYGSTCRYLVHVSHARHVACVCLACGLAVLPCVSYCPAVLRCPGAPSFVASLRQSKNSEFLGYWYFTAQYSYSYECDADADAKLVLPF